VTFCARLPWLVAQREEQLLFYNWPVAPRVVADRIPRTLEPDLFEGRAWLTLIPFQMRDLRARWTPPLPGLSAFGEVDCLTYVRPRAGGPGGIWFFRITAATGIGSWLARRLWGLPYVHRPVTLHQDGEWTRCVAGAREAPDFDVRYRGVGPVHAAAPGSLAHFLVERFVMYSATPGGTLLAGREARPPRPIQAAEVSVAANRIPALAGLPAPEGVVAAWTCAASAIRTWLPVPVTTTPGR
jgi:uncharacterized protein YqjF (DUF2071 family)